MCISLVINTMKFEITKFDKFTYYFYLYIGANSISFLKYRLKVNLLLFYLTMLSNAKAVRTGCSANNEFESWGKKRLWPICSNISAFD